VGFRVDVVAALVGSLGGSSAGFFLTGGLEYPLEAKSSSRPEFAAFQPMRGRRRPARTATSRLAARGRCHSVRSVRERRPGGNVAAARPPGWTRARPLGPGAPEPSPWQSARPRPAAHDGESRGVTIELRRQRQYWALEHRCAPSRRPWYSRGVAAPARTVVDAVVAGGGSLVDLFD
jgi:hypothetical protein